MGRTLPRNVEPWSASFRKNGNLEDYRPSGDSDASLWQKIPAGAACRSSVLPTGHKFLQRTGFCGKPTAIGVRQSR
jgi:hypothetical protein